MGNAVEIKVDAKEWVAALKEYAEESDHDMAYILNKRGRNIASRASRHTPRETPAGIKADLSKMSNGGRHYGPWLFVLTNAKRKKMGLSPVGGKSMSGPAIEFMKKRQASRAYIAAGWLPAIIMFGGHPKKEGENHKNSRIHRAHNKLATPTSLIALLENTATGSGEVGWDALKTAIDEDTADMLEHVERIKKTAEKHSAK